MSVAGTIKLTTATTYALSMNCITIINNLEGFAVLVTFTSFSTLTKDALLVYDGPSPLSPEIAMLSGSTELVGKSIGSSSSTCTPLLINLSAGVGAGVPVG
jgi:hypothetical protein